jgi:hypothetical protein
MEGKKTRPITDVTSISLGKIGMTMLSNSLKTVSMWQADSLLSSDLEISTRSMAITIGRPLNCYSGTLFS